MTLRRLAPWAVAAALCGPRLAGAALATTPGAGPELGLAQILERNAAARGGLEAWRKVKTMVWGGRVERADGAGMPFMLFQKRPDRTRFEVVVDRQRAVRVFDGDQGWTLRPGAGGRPEVRSFTEEERQAARDALVIDGPLLDGEAKGVVVRLEGPDEVEGRRAFRLRARLPSGATERVWIDAETFLEVKYERPSRGPDGRPGAVAVYPRDYKAFEGLQLPFALETRAAGGGPMVDRLVIERIAVDPPLADGMFARPDLRTSRRGITVDTRLPPRARGGGEKGPDAR